MIVRGILFGLFGFKSQAIVNSLDLGTPELDNDCFATKFFKPMHAMVRKHHRCYRQFRAIEENIDVAIRIDWLSDFSLRHES